MGGKWYYWLEPGVYAKYTYFQREKPFFFGENFYFVNESLASFTNFTLAWMVMDVHDLYATVDYNLTFYGVKQFTSDMGPFGPYIDVGNLTLNTIVTVRLDTLELVDDEGEPWGRWPYWVHGWEVDKNVTMIYNYPRSPVWMGHVGGEPKNITVTLGSGSLLNYFNTPVYNFTKERLIRANTHITLETVRNHTVGNFDTRFDAVYDSVSLVCVGFVPRSGEMADGIMYHKLGVWDIVYNDDIILVDTNVDFDPSEAPDEAPTVSAWLVAGIVAVVALPILGITIQLRNKRRRKATRR